MDMDMDMDMLLFTSIMCKHRCVIYI